MSAVPTEQCERLAADVLRSERAIAGADRFAAAARAAERAWAQQAAESWTEAAERLERARGVVRIVVSEIDGGVKTFARPATTLRGLLPLLREARVVDVQESLA